MLALPGVAPAARTPPIVLDWREVSPSGVIVLAALKTGLFAENGVAVTLRTRKAGDQDLAGLLRSGAVDASVVPAPVMLEPLLKGLEARFTAGLSGGGLRLLADRHAHLRRIEDVKHHRIGVGDPSGAARLFFSVMLRRKGINPFAEVTWVDVKPADMGGAIRDGTVDAIALADPDAFALLRAMKLTEIATNVSGSYRDRTFAALLVSEPLLRDTRRAGAVALTKALLGGSHLVATRTAEAAGLAAAIARAPLTPPDLVAMLKSEAPDQHPTGKALVDDIAAYVDELRLLGTIPFDLNSGRFARGVCQDVVAA